MSVQSDFAGKVKELIASAKDLSVEARQRVLDLLDEARTKIAAQLAEIDPESFSAAQLTVLRNSIDRAMEEFAKKATGVIEKAESSAFAHGGDMVKSPIAAAGIEGPGLGVVSTSALSVAQGYTADLITGLSKDAMAKINGVIQRAFLGGQKVSDIIQQIGRALGSGEGFTGVFKGIGRRAADITINEILRVQSISTQARLEDAADQHEDLQKQWHHLAIARVPRPGHVAADGQVVNVDEPFLVEGEELMFPRDPNGSPDNTINCHCMMAPYFSADALKPTKGQKGLLEELGISVSAA
jgi:uncharacterized protein with gpF-like domain